MHVSVRHQERLFDDWADSYDDETASPQHPFPHGGYDLVLAEVVKQAAVAPGQSVLDLGIGTAKLAVKLAALGCCIWGVDFSAEMLAQARAKLPDAVLVQVDLRDDWPPQIARRFDRIVSSYVLHEFDLDAKIAILRRAADHLVAGCRIVIGDIAFSTVEQRETARDRWYERWDDDEWYWAADETIVACREVGLEATYTQIARCGGVFMVVPSSTLTDQALGLDCRGDV
jgi:putative AdoMet-dependent methyltransferase